MSRQSGEERDAQGQLINGFDYEHQAWVANGRYVACGHPEGMHCVCYGRLHAGERS